MTKKEAAATAAKFLMHVYDQDMNACATIANAEAKIRDGEEGGEEVLADALVGVRDFVQGLINELIYQKKNERTDKPKYPRGC